MGKTFVGHSVEPFSTYLHSEFARHVPKGLQLFSVFADTLQVVFTELVLRIDQREDPLHQSGPEIWQDLCQTHAAPCRQ